jgi:hypothetical protein
LLTVDRMLILGRKTWSPDTPFQEKSITIAVKNWLTQFSFYAADTLSPNLEVFFAEYPDRRIKPVICTMASTGIRVGAWDYLKYGHITPIKQAIPMKNILLTPKPSEKN